MNGRVAELPAEERQPVSELPNNEISKEYLESRMLVEAAFKGRYTEVASMLKSRVDVNSRHSGFTALCRAAMAGHQDVVKLLIRKGADINARMDVGGGLNPGYGTALNWAADAGHLNIVKPLVKAEANTTIEAVGPAALGAGGTPLKMAAARGHGWLVEYLVGRERERDWRPGTPAWDAFICACELGRLGVVKYFVNPVDTSTLQGIKGLASRRKGILDGLDEGPWRHPFVRAAEYQQVAVMSFLYDRDKEGVAINRADAATQSTLLHYAAEKGLLRTAVWLAKNGADRRAKNAAGLTPLDLAKARPDKGDHDHEDLIKALDWNATSKSVLDGCTWM